MTLTCRAFAQGDMEAALLAEPLEQVVDDLKEALRSNHIRRLQKGGCTIESGFIWLDVLTDLERIADHCANIAASVLEDQTIHGAAQIHRSHSDHYLKAYRDYGAKYLNQ